MELLCSLYEAGLIRLLQHLLRVTHQTTVLQHALVLLHLRNILVITGFQLLKELILCLEKRKIDV